MPFFGVPIRNGLPIGLGSVAGFGVQQFDPSQLFAGGTVAGAWYDPSDLSTMFTTSAGTTPATMPGLGSAVSVGLMLDKSQNGVGTNGAKRVNLLTFSEQFDNAAWTKDGATAANTTATTDPLGGTTADILTATSAGAAYAYQGITAPTATVAFSCYVKAATASVFWTYYDSGGTNGTAFFGTDLTTQAVSGGSQTPSSLTITSVGNGWFRISAQWSSVSGSRNFGVGICDAKGSVTVTIGRTGYVWGADVRLASEANTLPLYQPITSSWYATLPGNHAISFNDTTARPELRARVNLLTYSEEFDNGAWVKGQTAVTANATIAPDGTLTADALFETAVTNSHFMRYGSAGGLLGVAQYKATLKVKANGRSKIQVLPEKVGSSQWAGCTFNLSNNTFNSTPITAGGASFVSASIVDDAEGFKLITVVATSTASGMDGILICLLDDISSETTIAPSYAGDATKGVFIWGADLRPANIGANVPAYQRIADANTYDTSGFPLYLRFDGIDDSMYTPANLNLSGTDKVAVFAGVRKLSQSTGQQIAELGNVSAGGWYLYPGNRATATGAFFTFLGRGTASDTASQAAEATPYAAPISAVLAATGNIPGDSNTLSVNAAAAVVATGDQGAGNYSTNPLYIGSRANGSLFFNGHLHSLIIAGSAVSAGNISATEQWVAGKTGLVIP